MWWQNKGEYKCSSEQLSKKAGSIKEINVFKVKNRKSDEETGENEGGANPSDKKKYLLAGMDVWDRCSVMSVRRRWITARMRERKEKKKGVGVGYCEENVK